MDRLQRPGFRRLPRPGRIALAGAVAGLVLVCTGCGGTSAAPTGPGTGTGTAASAGTPVPNLTPKVWTKPTPQATASGSTQTGGTVFGKQPITVSDASLVAQAKGTGIGVYTSATAGSPALTLTNPLPSGAPLVFLVQERRPDRLRVLLPIRPNESQGWVRVSDVTLSQHDYRIAVSTGGHTLTLYKGGAVVMNVPVGLGTGATPTPGGVFYLKELLRPPNPNGAYGPYAYGLSGYSTVLENFGGGDGELGIHGTDEPASIGKNVSHGCIRMSNDNITKLANMLPLGVPVQIIS
ncbi:MAG TPA: L,D-transpeptidase [Kineosporiaceae bacterium]|nr:L,D-transpeptidase [Kineosporiaceae bacterium]